MLAAVHASPPVEFTGGLAWIGQEYPKEKTMSYIESETLSDGSKVYNVHFGDCAWKTSITVRCADAKDAQALFDIIERCSEVEASEVNPPRVIVSHDDCGNTWVNSDREINVDIVPEWESERDAYDAEEIARFEALDAETETLEFNY